MLPSSLAKTRAQKTRAWECTTKILSCRGPTRSLATKGSSALDRTQGEDIGFRPCTPMVKSSATTTSTWRFQPSRGTTTRRWCLITAVEHLLFLTAPTSIWMWRSTAEAATKRQPGVRSQRRGTIQHQERVQTAMIDSPLLKTTCSATRQTKTKIETKKQSSQICSQNAEISKSGCNKRKTALKRNQSETQYQWAKRKSTAIW